VFLKIFTENVGLVAGSVKLPALLIKL